MGGGKGTEDGRGGPNVAIHLLQVLPEPDYIMNRSHPEFYQKIKEDLAVCGTVIKDFLFTTGLCNGRLMDPARQLRGLTAAEIWGLDPIHPKKEIFELLADRRYRG